MGPCGSAYSLAVDRVWGFSIVRPLARTVFTRTRMNYLQNSLALCSWLLDDRRIVRFHLSGDLSLGHVPHRLPDSHKCVLAIVLG